MKGYYGKMCKWPMVSLKREEWRDMEVLSVQIQTLNRLIYFPEVFPILFCFQLAKATIACNYKLWFKTYPIFFSWIFKFSSHCCLKKKKRIKEMNIIQIWSPTKDYIFGPASVWTPCIPNGKTATILLWDQFRFLGNCPPTPPLS